VRIRYGTSRTGTPTVRNLDTEFLSSTYSNRERARSTVGAVRADDRDAVLAANRAFYEAHEARNLAAMAGVWEHTDEVVCVHPGWPILRGWRMVEDSWRRIFAGPGRNQFILTNDVIVVDGDLAWVSLDENMMDGTETGTIAATNLFAHRPTGWYLVLHHGSPVMSG
jgi:ketosteroid isomerase-like protein